MTRIPDERVDAIRIHPRKTTQGSRGIGEVEGDELVLTSSLDWYGWTRLPMIARSVVAGTGVGLDGTGFRFPEDLDPDEEPFEGVEVYNPLGTVHVSRPAFERLMARYLRANITGAKEHDDPVVHEPWWPELEAKTAELEERLARR